MNVEDLLLLLSEGVFSDPEFQFPVTLTLFAC